MPLRVSERLCAMVNTLEPLTGDGGYGQDSFGRVQKLKGLEGNTRTSKRASRYQSSDLTSLDCRRFGLRNDPWQYPRVLLRQRFLLPPRRPPEAQLLSQAGHG